MANLPFCAKADFSLPATAHYLNCAYIGPISKKTEQAGIDGVRIKSAPMDMKPIDFFAPSEEARAAFGKLINTSAENIAFIPAASYGIATLLRNIKFKRGQNIVLPAEEFPSNVNELRHLSQSEGLELRTIARPPELQNISQRWSTDIINAIDNHTALVILTANHWTDGTRFQLAAIAKKARQKNAILIVDGSQSVGASPMDFDALAPDALLCIGYKFLLGPYTCGFMVLGERFMGTIPLEHNWKNRRHSEDFHRLTDYRDDFQPGARRHDFGQHSSSILIPMLKTAIDQLLHWGSKHIADHCSTLFSIVEEELKESDYAIAPATEHSSHLFGIQVNQAQDLTELTNKLARQQVYLSTRGNALRVSTHIYNDEQDMLALAKVLRSSQQK